ncbi:hypothetical protein EJO66_12600 [Variovorax beijingensis]|uniref:Type IV pilus assembly protein PilX n=1 Tax=Variovorax beijingensis TaxID=2496117 RepID=A0ABY0A7W6_9BURK|nr:hypothetical protein [Variovorax beijingensis]RSZ37535.1 hypothetical protein EJO66_12600 [Variovorax beijingensis]
MKTSFRRRPAERGVVLLLCLIVLVVLLAGGVAVMRSMNTSLSSAGNLAFKRDLVNQGEQAADTALKLFGTGALSAAGADIASAKAQNYSAEKLPSNDRGIPLALLSDTAFDAVASATNDIKDASRKDQVKVRYIIDRLCNAPGAPSKSNCVYAPGSTDVRGGSVQESQRPPPPKALVYRLSIRVDGPRDTQVFLQSSFTKPE